MHKALRQLAEERSPEGRTELLFKLSELFIQERNALSGTEVYLFNDIMEKIVDSAERQYRVAMARQLAGAPAAPEGVMMRLASDSDIEVARPVLRTSEALKEEDLVAIASLAAQDRLLAIAERRTLSTAVTDILVDRGEAPVLHSVSANPGAAFTPASFGKLLAKAESDVDLKALLASRADLPGDIMDRLMPAAAEAVTTELRQRGIEIPTISAGHIDLMRRAFAAGFAKHRSNLRNVDALAAQVRREEMSIDVAAQELLANSRLFDLAPLLSLFVQLDENCLLSIIAKGNSALVAVLMKAVDASWPTVDRTLRLRAERHLAAFAPDEMTEADYAAIEPASARRIVRFLRLRRLTGHVPAAAPPGGAPEAA